MFKKNNIIRFTNYIDAIVDSYPIVSSSKIQRPWLKLSTDQYKNEITKFKSGCPFAGFRPKNIAKCPGIKSLFDIGYVMTCPYDVRITTNGDGTNINWDLPFTSNEMGFAPVAIHKPDVLFDHLDPPPNTVKSILKLDAGWQVTAPDDVLFLMTNLNYTEEKRFTSVTGILDPKNSTKLISQLYWHVINGSEIIKAGTPLMHIIPIKRGFNPDFVCDLPNQDDMKRQKISYYKAINTFF